MHGLSIRQKDIVAFIESFVNTYGHSPSYREIGKHLNLRSLGTIYKHIQTLSKKGVLKTLPRQGRSVALTTPPLERSKLKGGVTLQLMGYMRAGHPIDMLPIPQQITVPFSMVSCDQKTYLLRARGDGLHEELIADGDLILIETRVPFCEGETVLCIINHSDTVIKQYFREDEYIRLVSRSSEHYPILIRENDVKILGVVTGLLRVYA